MASKKFIRNALGIVGGVGILMGVLSDDYAHKKEMAASGKELAVERKIDLQEDARTAKKVEFAAFGLGLAALAFGGYRGLQNLNNNIDAKDTTWKEINAATGNIGKTTLG